MKASDLRIGNYATIDNPKAWPDVKGIPLKVSGTRSFKDEDFPASTGDVKLMGGKYSQFDEFIQPVPLTEEWLKKFGFESDSVCWEKSIHLHNDPEKTVISIGDYKYGYFYVPSSIEWPGVKIEYVHQLQNLWHALTGEELTIKEGKECQNAAHYSK